MSNQEVAIAVSDADVNRDHGGDVTGTLESVAPDTPHAGGRMGLFARRSTGPVQPPPGINVTGSSASLGSKVNFMTDSTDVIKTRPDNSILKVNHNPSSNWTSQRNPLLQAANTNNNSMSRDGSLQASNGPSHRRSSLTGLGNKISVMASRTLWANGPVDDDEKDDDRYPAEKRQQQNGSRGKLAAMSNTHTPNPKIMATSNMNDREEDDMDQAEELAKFKQINLQQRAPSTSSSAGSFNAQYPNARELSETLLMKIQEMKWSLAALAANCFLLWLVSSLQNGLQVPLDVSTIGTVASVVCEVVLLIANVLTLMALNDGASAYFGYLLVSKRGFSYVICGFAQAPPFRKWGFANQLSLNSSCRGLLARISLLWMLAEMLKLMTPISATSLWGVSQRVDQGNIDCILFKEQNNPVDRLFPTVDSEAGFAESSFGSALGYVRSEVTTLNVTTFVMAPQIIGAVNDGDTIVGSGYTTDISTSCTCSPSISAAGFQAAGVPSADAATVYADYMAITSSMGLASVVNYNATAVVIHSALLGSGLCGGINQTQFTLICETTMSNHSASTIRVSYMTDGTTASVAQRNVDVLSIDSTANMTWVQTAMYAIMGGKYSSINLLQTVPGTLNTLMWWTSTDLVAINPNYVEAGLETTFSLLLRAGTQRTYTTHGSSCIRNIQVGGQSILLMKSYGVISTVISLSLQLVFTVISILCFFPWLFSSTPIGPGVRLVKETIYSSTMLMNSPLGEGLQQCSNAQSHSIWQALDKTCRIGEAVTTLEELVGRLTLMKPIPSYLARTQQLAKAQALHPNGVVLLQVGSFFEIGDTPGYQPYVEEVAQILNLRIGHRSRPVNSTEDNRIVGFPTSNLRRSVDILLDHGKTVVIVEQRGRHSTKAHFLREVARVVTPGTPLEDWQESKENHFLLSCQIQDNVVGLAWVDVSTGEFFLGRCKLSELESVTSRITPREVLFAESSRSTDAISYINDLSSRTGLAVSFVEDSFFDAKQGSKRLTSLLVKADPTKSLAKRAKLPTTDAILRKYHDSQISAAGALLGYVIRNYAGAELVFQTPLSMDDENCMALDGSTLQALEVTSTLRERKRVGSLLHVLDETVTAAGGRLLTSRLRSPSTSEAEINRRLDLVDYFAKDTHLCDEIRSLLRNCKDVERGIQRLHVDATSPQDFSNVIRTLAQIGQVKDILTRNIAPPALSHIISNMGSFEPLIEQYDGIFEEGKHDETSISEGGIVSLSFSPDIASLDLKTKQLQDERHALAIELLSQYSIKHVKSNSSKEAAASVIDSEILKVDPREGPIIDVSRTRSVPPNEVDVNSDVDCKRVSSMGGIVMRRLMTAKRLRFTHPAWTDLYSRIGELEARRIEIERSILRDACEELKGYTLAIGSASKAMAEVDVSVALGILAREKQYVRPTLVNEAVHDVQGGRHPVVEVAQRERGIQFVKNDCFIGKESRMWLLTGPNMGGKSTFLRQCALMSIMAQAGSFVAADSARLGIVDAIFSRVGAADDLGRNQSTFMVEMEETATILKKATSKSYVIMDEVGRGTSTLDGVAIAHAVLVYLRDQIQCCGVFATHYHELGSSVGAINSNSKATVEGVASHHTSIHVDEDGRYTYIYKIMPGVMSTSHGIEVARLAGLPDQVLDKAQQVRAELASSAVFM
ncbi:hypothetical protein SmJEL517_g05674 [Synchytrium microbalum]|uniref:Uncharacterized protein n=1 Tax=Synchytrium microbalum TaxID=1806994 RepID=A0A507C022_9FUNG|nr:uncharacterized protein SmJEL517_g05674 [Synchytrium microbalum]TPX30873.1 hypothetical protein SmJEL517_g05674 [Synchytrium microbalum]